PARPRAKSIRARFHPAAAGHGGQRSIDREQLHPSCWQKRLGDSIRPRSWTRPVSIHALRPAAARLADGPDPRYEDRSQGEEQDHAAESDAIARIGGDVLVERVDQV